MRHETNHSGVAGSTCRFEPLETRQLMSGGSLDTTFGAGGKLAPAVGFVAQDVAVQPDGKTVLVGEHNNNFAIARLNANGTRDLGFGSNGNGIVTLHFDGNAEADRVLIQPDGKILIGGISEGLIHNHVAFGRLL